MEPKKMYKSSTDKQVMGVCGGLAEYFNIDSTILRVIFLVLLFAGSSGFWIYMILGIVLPYDFQVKNKMNSRHSSNFGQGNKRDVTPEDDGSWDDF